MSSERADIILKISSDLTEMRKAQEEFRNLKEAGSQSAVKMGAAFAAANQALSAAIQGIKGFFKETIAEGVKLNSQLETTARGMAAVMHQYNPGKFGDFKDAVRTSTAMLEDLRAKAADAGLGVGDVVDAFQDAVPVFSSMRVPVGQQTSLLVESAKAMQMLGVSTGDTRRELMALFTGHALERSRLAMGLGITKRDLENAREQGRLVELITQRLDDFNRGTSGVGDTLETVELKLKNAISNQAIDATKELTGAYKDLLVSITALAKSEAAKGLMQYLGDAAAGAVKRTARFVDEIDRQIASNPGTIMRESREIVAGIQEQINAARSMADVDKQRLTIVEQIAAAEKNVAKYQALIPDNDPANGMATHRRNAAQQRVDALKSLQESLDVWQDLDGIIARNSVEAAKEAAAAKVEAEREAAAEAQRLAEERQQAAADWLKKNSAAYEEQIAAAKRAMLADSEQLAAINELIAAKERERDAGLSAAGSEEERTKISLESERKLLELRKQAATLQERIEKAAERAAAEASRRDSEAKKQQLKDLDDQLQAKEKQLHGDLFDISIKQSENQSDRAKSDIEKRTENVRLLEDERRKMQELLDVLEAMEKSVGDDEAAQKIVGARLDKLRDDIRKKDVQIGSEKSQIPYQGLERFNDEMAKMRKNSDDTFDVMNAGFQGMSSGINDALTNAKNLGDGFKKVLSSIGKGIADAVIQIISMKIAMAAVNGISGMFGFSGGGNVPEVPGHDVGGFTMPGPVLKPAGIVHAGEWVAPQWMVRSPSVGPVISALENARVARRGFASGGATTTDALLPIASGAAGGGGGDTYQFNYTFQSGVTRDEVAALIPVIEQRTIAAVADKQRRRQM